MPILDERIRDNAFLREPQGVGLLYTASRDHGRDGRDGDSSSIMSTDETNLIDP